MKAEITLPLLDDNEKRTRFKETIPEYQAFLSVFKMSTLCFLGTMFIPINVVVNTMVLGHNSDPHLLGGLGLGSATVGMYGAFSWAFSQGGAVVIS